MEFGQRNAFAIEAYADKVDAERGWVFGRMRCWITGLPLGDIDETNCMLNVSAQFLEVKLRTLDNLSNDTLNSLTDRMAFKCLDQALYTEGIEPVDLPDGDNFDYRFDFLTNGGESFDRTKSFILRDADQLRVIFQEIDSPTLAGRFPVTAFQDAVMDFQSWMKSLTGA